MFKPVTLYNLDNGKIKALALSLRIKTSSTYNVLGVFPCFRTHSELARNLAFVHFSAVTVTPHKSKIETVEKKSFYF